MLNSESSLRLKLIRFPLIVCVVFIHSYATTVGFSDSSIGASQNGLVADFVRNLISQGVARASVPLFFLMSGYLFFVKGDWSKESYIEKLKSRAETLLVPFLFWNIATLLLFALAQMLPVTQGYFSSKNISIADFSTIDYVNAIFGIGRSPISYQFWFIRDLMVLVLLAPVIYFLNKRMPLLFISILFLCWFLNFWHFYVPSSEAILFFVAGSLLATEKKSLFAADKYGWVITLAYAFILTADIVFIKSEWSSFLHKIDIIFGVLTFLFLTKLVVNSVAIKNAILSLESVSFFVFAAHEPLLVISRKIAYKFIEPSSDFSVLGLYFAIPTLVIVFLVFAYRFLLYCFPSLTRIITGGR